MYIEYFEPQEFRYDNEFDNRYVGFGFPEIWFGYGYGRRFPFYWRPRYGYGRYPYRRRRYGRWGYPQRRWWY